MQLKNISIKNFRLLHDVCLTLEEQTTVIVGRNNSGKTSLTEVMRRLLGDSNPSFRLEDFSFATHKAFWSAFLIAMSIGMKIPPFWGIEISPLPR
jgi:predicted ATP-dependent endonuclease of OLD family